MQHSEAARMQSPLNYNTWQKDLKDSTAALLSIKDTVLPKLIRGDIYSIENQSENILIKIDVVSGIDFIRHDDVGLQGIAARVQWGNDWNTFTIRKERHSGKETELKKRIRQIREGYFSPAFTLQAYFDNRVNNNLLSIAIIKTVDLYSFVINNPEKCLHRASDNSFICVKWDDLTDSIKQYP